MLSCEVPVTWQDALISNNLTENTWDLSSRSQEGRGPNSSNKESDDKEKGL